MSEKDAMTAALRHAVNYHGLDAKLGMADHKIAELLSGEVVKHLAGKTDVQIIEAMTPEERSRIGLEARDE
jgi:hypothetical protein